MEDYANPSVTCREFLISAINESKAILRTRPKRVYKKLLAEEMQASARSELAWRVEAGMDLDTTKMRMAQWAKFFKTIMLCHQRAVAA